VIALLLALAAFPCAARAQVETHIERARLALTGPLERVRVVAGANQTMLEAHLAAGEHFEIGVPLATSSTDVEPQVEALDGDARNARFVAWDPAFASASTAWWESQSFGLRARPRPSLPGSDAASLGRAPATALLLLFAFVPLAIALRRRAKTLVGVAVVCSAALVAITLRERAKADYARVLEGDGASQRWLAVDCALDTLRMPAATPMRLALEPAQASVALDTTLATAEHGPWNLAAARARLWLTTPCDPLERKFTPQSNAWGTLEQCWVRAADGAWTARGTWEIGRPLPAARDEPGDPPGWLNPALPMGSSILIGRLAPGSFAGEGAGVGPVWVRLVGF
jgi:hypothetical protein